MDTFPALVVDALRTPFGAHNTKLSTFHAVDLLATAFTGVVERSGIPVDDIDHVIAGCAVPVGEQAINVARSAVLAANWPESLPAHTIDAQSVSGVLAFHEAVARVRSGMSRVCLVGAVASTRVPDGASTGVAVGKPFGTTVHDRFADAGGLRSPAVMAEHLARQMHIDRLALDRYAQRSVVAARHATEMGKKKPYLLAIRDAKKVPTIVSEDKLSAKRDITKLKPLFENDGLLTAATFAMPVNGAVAIIIARLDSLPNRNQPAVEVVAVNALGSDVLLGSSGARVATQALLRAGKDMQKKLTHVEVHEDSAVTPLAFMSDCKTDESILNTEGGSLAFGDAFGVSGLASIVSLLHAIQHDQNALGLAVSAGASAISTATVVKVHRS